MFRDIIGYQSDNFGLIFTQISQIIKLVETKFLFDGTTFFSSVKTAQGLLCKLLRQYLCRNNSNRSSTTESIIEFFIELFKGSDSRFFCNSNSRRIKMRQE
ncbi:hypothetical protein [Vaccinia virus]|nr:hypothetical protein [Vaccinia virus]